MLLFYLLKKRHVPVLFCYDFTLFLYLTRRDTYISLLSLLAFVKDYDVCKRTMYYNEHISYCGSIQE